MAQSESATASRLAPEVAHACLTGGLLRPGQGVLVAVSAGPDSGALAGLLAEVAGHGLALRLELGHVDHGWRGNAEAAADRAVVEELAARLELPLHVSPPPPREHPRTEDGARQWRYRRLARMASERGLTHVATGHHAGDQAETFLMRLLRGSGLVGLAGIPARRPLGRSGLTVVRPLLTFEPSALRAYVERNGLPWRADPTNADLSRERARIRARLGGEQREVRPGLAALARRLRRRLERREEALAHVARESFRHHEPAQAVEMPRALLALERGEDLALLLRAAGRLLAADAEGPWLTRRHVFLIERLLQGTGDLDLPRGLVLHAQGKRVWLARRTWSEPTLPRLSLTVRPPAPGACEAAVGSALLDADRLGASPRLRILAAGDRFTPHGRGGEGRVSIRAWLSRRGVPELGRRGQLVVEGAGGIAWVVGYRVDRDHVVTPETRSVAQLALDRRDERDALCKRF